MTPNPYQFRLDKLIEKARAAKLEAVVLSDVANVRSVTGLTCDNAVLLVKPSRRGRSAAVKFYTDFRYVPMVHRSAPWLEAGDIREVDFKASRIGCEFSMPHAKFLELSAAHSGAEFVDVSEMMLGLRAVKSEDEIWYIRRAEHLTCSFFRQAIKDFRPGMTEIKLAQRIKAYFALGAEGEAFDTIVCIGRNAAECHHIPNDTVWTGKEPILVDLGIKYEGYCGDLTRNKVPRNVISEYRDVYRIVKEANKAAIRAARPGMTAGELDAVARGIIERAGYGKAFGHALGHGVGLEIHEWPVARKGSEMVLEPGMVVTIEPGIYLEDKLGVRIEDLILITKTGCECLSDWAAK